MLCTRQYQNKANKELWQSLKRLLTYIKGTIEIKLVYKMCYYEDILIGYVDMRIGQVMKLTDEVQQSIGYVYKLFGSCAITCNTKRQSSVAASSTEEEYMALFE